MLTRAGCRGGSVSMLTPELSETICARLASGETLLSVGADPEMPAASTICGWVRRYEDFREAYVTAKGIAADLLFELALEVALDCDAETVQADRLRIQTLRWQAAMLAPKTYGERVRWGPTPDKAEADEPPRQVLQVITQRFFNPPCGPQFVDGDGNPVPRPKGHYSPLPEGWTFEPVPEGEVAAWEPGGAWAPMG